MSQAIVKMKLQLPKGFDLIVRPQRQLKPAFIFARLCSAVTYLLLLPTRLEKMFFFVALLVFLQSSPDFIQASPLSLSKDLAQQGLEDFSHNLVVVEPAFGKYSASWTNTVSCLLSLYLK